MGLDATPSLSLHRGRQPDVETPQVLAGCELLSNLYLYIVVDNRLSVFNSISIGCKDFRKIKNDCLLRKSLTDVGLFCGVNFLRAHCIWVVWGIICNFVV